MNFATKLGSYQHRNNLWYVAIQRWGVVEGMWGWGRVVGRSPWPLPCIGATDLPAQSLPDFWLHLFVLVYTKYEIWTWGVDWLFFGNKDATTVPPWAEKLLQTIGATITKMINLTLKWKDTLGQDLVDQVDSGMMPICIWSRMLYIQIEPRVQTQNVNI